MEKVKENLFGSVKKASKGISILQIENAFNKLNNQDIDKNFLGVFPANNVNRFIEYKTIILEKRKVFSYHSKHRQL